MVGVVENRESGVAVNSFFSHLCISPLANIRLPVHRIFQTKTFLYAIILPYQHHVADHYSLVSSG